MRLVAFAFTCFAAISVALIACALKTKAPRAEVGPEIASLQGAPFAEALELPFVSVSYPARDRQGAPRKKRRSHSRKSDSSQADDEAIDNWDLEGSGLKPDEIAPFLGNGQPESIVFFDRDSLKRIYPIDPNAVSKGAKTLFVGDSEFIKKTARERKERADQQREDTIDEQTEERLVSLQENAYEIVRFSPGKRDNGEVVRPVAANYLSALQGPDYSLAAVDSNREDSMRALLSTVLSLGHSGEIVLRVKEDGFIADRPGFDFAVYENAFRIDGTRKIFQEFGSIGVSESPDESDYRWYACDPKAAVVQGCVGAVPTEEGGDQFDLAELGLKRIRYIWIKDLGINKNFPSKWPTEGVDLDALRLSHAYRNE